MVENLKKKKIRLFVFSDPTFAKKTHFWKCESCGSLILSDQLILLNFELRDLIALKYIILLIKLFNAVPHASQGGPLVTVSGKKKTIPALYFLFFAQPPLLVFIRIASSFEEQLLG